MKKLILISVLMCVALVAGCHHRPQTPKSVKNVHESKPVEIVHSPKKENTSKTDIIPKADNISKTDRLPKTEKTIKNINISVLMDIGSYNLTQVHIEQRERLNVWMGKDLVKLLNKAGYKANLIENRSRYKPGIYLLKVSIVKYNTGTKAARINVSYGAGAVSLATRYEVFAPSGKRILSDEHGVDSSIDWTSCARKLNKQTLEALSGKLKY